MCKVIGHFISYKQNNKWMCRNIKFISRGDKEISLVCFAQLEKNLDHISAHPCIILYVISRRKAIILISILIIILIMIY